jgi:hypothetical protein
MFGTRISAAIAQRTFAVFDAVGLVRIAHARDFSWDQLVALLDQGLRPLRHPHRNPTPRRRRRHR